jgi:hypothetical protein
LDIKEQNLCWFQLDIDNVTRMTVTATLNSTQYFPEDSVPIEKSSQEKIENQHNTVFDNKKENENVIFWLIYISLVEFLLI